MARPRKIRTNQEFRPYLGPDSLDKCKVLEQGKNGAPSRIEYGAPSFIVARADKDRYKVIALYSTPRGRLRRVWRVLRPSRNRPQDRDLMRRLKEAGVPGAV